LSRAIDEQSRRLVLSLGRARRGDGKGVHRARVASRRLRELMAIASRATHRAECREHRRSLRHITGALGPARELDVTREVLKNAGLRHRWPQDVVTRLDRILETLRLERQATLAEQLPAPVTRILLRGLRTAAAGIAGDRESAFEGRLTARCRSRSASLSKCLRRLGKKYKPDRLHEVRIAAKKLRYVLEAARQVQSAPVGREIRGLVAAQELLGQLHDLQVLQEHVRLVTRDAAISQSLIASYRQVDADVERDCRALHARVVTRRIAWRQLAKHARKR
jgi:CHAD domain-containing protein